VLLYKMNSTINSTPKVEYSNLKEWEEKKKDAYQIIKNGLDKWIIEDSFEYQHMSYQGITPRQKLHIQDYISDALSLITKNSNKEWTEKIAFDIVYGIRGFFNGFIETGIWDSIYSQLDPVNMSKLIFNNIVWQLDDDNHWPCILAHIALFTCETCGKKDTYITDENICNTCDGYNSSGSTIDNK